MSNIIYSFQVKGSVKEVSTCLYPAQIRISCKFMSLKGYSGKRLICMVWFLSHWSNLDLKYRLK